jgi:hypothetical protein
MAFYDMSPIGKLGVINSNEKSVYVQVIQQDLKAQSYSHSPSIYT